jgi:PAS domain-containing protein
VIVKWEDVPVAELAKAVDRRNGRIQQMRGFLTLIDVAATVKDRTGRILWANRAAEVLFDASLGDFRGKTIDQVLGPRDYKKAQVHLLQVIGTDVAAFEYHRSDSYAVIRFPFRDDDDQVLIVALRVKM